MSTSKAEESELRDLKALGISRQRKVATRGWKRQGEDSPLEWPEEGSPADILTLGQANFSPLTSRTVREEMCVEDNKSPLSFW